MGSSHRVEIILLHQADILLHFFSRDRLATEFTMVVAIYAIEFNRHAIDQEFLSVKPYITEAYLATAGFHQIGIAVNQRKYQRVQHRGLCSPLLRFRNLLFQQSIIDIISLRILFSQYLIHIYFHRLSDGSPRRIMECSRHFPVSGIRLTIHIY